MPNILKTLLTIVIATAGSTGALVLYTFLIHNLVSGISIPWTTAALIGAILGFLYGLEAGILRVYDLDSFAGWIFLIIDFSWSYPNTIYGLVLGNLFYPFFGALSREQSEGQNWIVYAHDGSIAQTLGTVNLGGAGKHERVHLLQSRACGPLFLPFGLVCYAVTFLIQSLFTLTVGMALWLARVRQSPYFRPPEHSAVHGFFGWIYFATPFELWAYATEG
jgi:hypothetical protein